MLKSNFSGEIQSCQRVHSVFLYLLSRLRFGSLKAEITRHHNLGRKNFLKKQNSGRIRLSWLVGDCTVSFGCIKLQLLVLSAFQNLQKVQKWRKSPKFVGPKVFEFLSDFDEEKTFVILSTTSETFAPTTFSKPITFKISSIKNADFYLGVHYVKITAVVVVFHGPVFSEKWNESSTATAGFAPPCSSVESERLLWTGFKVVVTCLLHDRLGGKFGDFIFILLQILIKTNPFHCEFFCLFSSQRLGYSCESHSDGLRIPDS